MKNQPIKSELRVFPIEIFCKKCDKVIGKIFIASQTVTGAFNLGMTDAYSKKAVKLLREHFKQIHNE